VAHAHRHDHGVDISLRTKRVTTAVSGGIGLVVAVWMLFVGFGTDVRSGVEGVLVDQVFAAEVEDVRIGPCTGTTEADEIDCRIATIVLR
jgi:hypothetical protein